MSIIKLKNVSKFYYNKGVIASGFAKLNVEFNIGEFVAITGESGSGKSTLLNVLSGLDTYEEGELYINGEETSHYNDTDFENYRRKYISNIFQSFNLINSYTVYQNIELVLLLNGYSKRKIKQKVLDLIDTVDLMKFKNTKVSKLSGGQKQRVAIARALAKDTPIIIADEPTGNLSSNQAKEIIKLLNKISKDKLVIVVTHNYEQVEEYVTRKIKMHDGSIIEDKKIKPENKNVNATLTQYKNINFISKLRLGIRNTYNIIPKFLLLVLIYLFMITALMGEYASFKEQEYIMDKSGYNYYFRNTSDDRIVIKKNDKSSFTEEDYNKISSLDNIKSIVKNDLLLDTKITLSDDDLWLYGNADSLNNFSGELDKGHMPNCDNEIILVGNSDDYYLGYKGDDLIGRELDLRDLGTDESTGFKLKVVGIKYNDSTANTTIYMNDSIIDKLTYQVNQQYSNLQVLFMDKYNESNIYNPNYKIIQSNNVEFGKVFISSDLNYLCKNENCINNPLTIEIKNLYYTDSITLTVSKSYTKNNYKKLTGLSNYEDNNGAIFINPENYNYLFNRAPYQSTIFVEDVNKIDNTITELNNMGISTLKVKDTLVKNGELQILRIFKTAVTIILVIALFFISYFVIRIILKSRNVYFSTIRMLGANKNIARELLIIELLNVATISYIIYLSFIYLQMNNIIDINLISKMLKYLKTTDYILIYVILMTMSYIISIKFSKKLFKNSAITTIREEV